MSILDAGDLACLLKDEVVMHPNASASQAGEGEMPRFVLGPVTLTVRDLNRVSDYYQQAIGLHQLGRDGAAVHLGAGQRVLLELREDRHARQRSHHEAGLFHTAFLLPDQPSLGRWLEQAVARRTPLAGLADHAVSQAIYLMDPEGNGIEVYADRPASAWRWQGGQVHMTTDPLDTDDLLSQAAKAPSWDGVPEGTTVGHVHLQVGSLEPAQAFYAGVLGMKVTCRYPGGLFYAFNGYHHHLATNIWNSQGAGLRTYPSTGLAEVRMAMDLARVQKIGQRAGQGDIVDGTLVLRDPWATAITLTQTRASNASSS